MKDLWVLVADADMEATVRTLLDRRRPALGIREVSYTITRHLRRDPGCRREAVPTARSFLNDHKHALVVFDKDGSGDEAADRVRIQNAVEEDLRQNGWENRSKAIVIEPELEAWVWSVSVNVSKVLGWEEGTEVLRSWLQERNLWPDGATKPPDPKSAMRRAMREKNRKPNAVTFRRLAERVAFRKCEDLAFQEMRATLQAWFPATGA